MVISSFAAAVVAAVTGVAVIRTPGGNVQQIDVDANYVCEMAVAKLDENVNFFGSMKEMAKSSFFGGKKPTKYGQTQYSRREIDKNAFKTSFAESISFPSTLKKLEFFDSMDHFFLRSISLHKNTKFSFNNIVEKAPKIEKIIFHGTKQEFFDIVSNEEKAPIVDHVIEGQFDDETLYYKNFKPTEE